MATGSADPDAGSSLMAKTCEFCGSSGPSPSWLWSHHRGMKCYEKGGHATLESYQREYRNRERRDKYKLDPGKELLRKKDAYSANADKEAAKKREAYTADPNKERSRKRDAYAEDPEEERSRKRDAYAADPEKERSRMAGETELRAARKRDVYTEDPEKERSRKRDAYAADPEEERSRKRDAYAADPEEERSRKRDAYAADPEEERSRKRDAYAADPEKERSRKKMYKTRSAEESVAKHLNEVIYGPQFACLCCNTHNFLCDVVPASEIEGLKSAPNRHKLIDMSFVEANACMLEQLDCQHVCLKCVEYIDAGNVPPMAAVNGLKCTWSSLSDDFLSPGQRELEYVALTRLFCTIEGLRNGISGHSGGLTKNMLLPLTKTSDATWLHAFSEETQQGWPRGNDSREMPLVDADIVIKLFRRLLQDHPLYDLEDKNVAVQSMKDLLSRTCGSAGASVGSHTSASHGNDEDEGYLDHFTEHCPKVEVLYSVLLPDGKNLSANTEELIGLKDFAERVGGALYDLHHQAGIDAVRDVEIQEMDWITSRLRHVHRRGPLNQPLLVFSVLLRQELRKLRSALFFAGSLRRHAGSSKYYQQIAEDLAVIDDFFGSPLFSVTCSLNAGGDAYLATWVSHEEGTAGRPVQVWHTSSEQDKLLLQPGREEPAQGSDAYFVHEREDAASSCPYHPGCKRQPLRVYQQR